MNCPDCREEVFAGALTTARGNTIDYEECACGITAINGIMMPCEADFEQPEMEAS